MAEDMNGDLKYFHDYGCLVSHRVVYFGSAGNDSVDDETGVDYQSSRIIMKNLMFLDTLNHKEITICWNSPGGCWHRGMAIYDTIRGLKSKVTMVGFGMVRSMGTIIMQACDKRLLSPNCDFMIHDGEEGWIGIPKSFESWGGYSKYTRKVMYSIYHDKIIEKHPKFKLKTIERMCSHDYILTGQETVDLGLADKIIGG